MEFFQYIDTPTHIKGHILDLIRCSSLTPLSCTVADLDISDYFFLSFSIPLCFSLSKTPHLIHFRNIRDIKNDTLSSHFS